MNSPIPDYYDRETASTSSPNLAKKEELTTFEVSENQSDDDERISVFKQYFGNVPSEQDQQIKKESPEMLKSSIAQAYLK